MKAKLEFDLDNNEDNMAHFRCVKSLDMALVLFEIIYNLKKKAQYKYEAEGGNELEIAYDFIYELCEEHGINIDNLIN